MEVLHPNLVTHLQCYVPKVFTHATGQAVLDKLAVELFGEGTIVSKVQWGWNHQLMAGIEFEVVFLQHEIHDHYGNIAWEVVLTNAKCEYKKHFPTPKYDYHYNPLSTKKWPL